MSEKRFICGLGFPINSDDPIRIISDSVEDKDYYKFSDICNVLNEQQSIIRRDEISIKTMMSNMKKLEKENEDLREVNKENQRLHEENVKQCERWKNLYELKDAEVTARVDALNRVCKYYISETRFKADTDPNKAVKEVINEILNAPIYEEG